MPRRRADLLLVERGFFASRAKAQAAIAAGLVTVDGTPVAQGFGSGPGRGRDRRRGAASLGLARRREARGGARRLRDRSARAASASTSAPRRAASPRCSSAAAPTRVYAVDVGHGQLHPKLAADPRVVSLEATDARRLDRILVPEPIDLLVADVSFISLKLVLPPVVPLLAPRCGARRPGEAAVRGRAGACRGRASCATRPCSARVATTSRAFVASLGFRSSASIPSPILGREGNREFLIGRAAWLSGS